MNTDGRPTHDGQLSLPGLDIDPPPFVPAAVEGAGPASAYRLFFALFPQPDDAQRLAQCAAGLRTQHGLSRRCLHAARLHVTLHVVALFQGIVAQQLIDAARAAGASVNGAPIPLCFDRALSFRNAGKPRSNAFVLRCDAAGDAAIARLRAELARPLRHAGLRPQPSETPHLTLLYDRRVVPEHPIPPLGWTAARVVLVLSHLGLTHHEWLGCWSLDNPADP